MSNSSIEDRVQALKVREEKIKLQLDSDSTEMKEKASRIGKIALVSGIVAILGYWIFNIIFQEENEEPKKKKKKRKESKGFTERIVTLAMPYVNNALDGVLNDVSVDDKKESQKSEKD